MASLTSAGAGTDGFPIEKSKTFSAPTIALRFFAYLIALYFPALLVALFVRHTALLPEKLISLITDARETLPFSVFW